MVSDGTDFKILQFLYKALFGPFKCFVILLTIQRVPALHGLWDLKKTALRKIPERKIPERKIPVSGTAL